MIYEINAKGQIAALEFLHPRGTLTIVFADFLDCCVQFDLKKRASRRGRPRAVSLRFTEEADFKLRAMAMALNETQAGLIESLLNSAYESVRQEYSADLNRAEQELRLKFNKPDVLRKP